MPAEIAVLVLNYNEKECLLRCLEACAKLDQDGVRVNLVCIDNGSGEDFLYMHRQMIVEVNKLLEDVGKPPINPWLILVIGIELRTLSLRWNVDLHSIDGDGMHSLLCVEQGPQIHNLTVSPQDGVLDRVTRQV